MLIVKKFGGTSVGNKERILNVAKRCIEEYQKGNDVVVVLSAMGKMTDELIAMAKDINPNPPKREMDMLLTTGEQTSVAMMAMAMHSMGIPAVSLNAFQVAMHTTHAYSNARIKRIDTDRIFNELEQRKIVIVTGFQGVDRYDNYTTLGRGGSDTTAVALAAALNADAWRWPHSVREFSITVLWSLPRSTEYSWLSVPVLQKRKERLSKREL